MFNAWFAALCFRRPRDLKPFPNSLVMQFTGHTGAVRSIALDSTGEYLMSGGEDGEDDVATLLVGVVSAHSSLIFS